MGLTDWIGSFDRASTHDLSNNLEQAYEAALLIQSLELEYYNDRPVRPEPRGLRLSTMGIMQFIAPTLQFVIGMLGGEPFTTAHMVTFGLIWAGVATFTYSQLRRQGREPATDAK